MVVRGVPERLANDAWWLDDEDPPNGLRAGPVLLLVVLCADLLIWDFRPGAGLAFWMLVAGVATALTLYRVLDRRRVLIALTVLIICVAPLLEVVQLGTFLVALAGLLTCGVILAAPAFALEGLTRAVLRLPGAGIVQTFRDLFAMRVAAPSKGSVKSVLFDWALPQG